MAAFMEVDTTRKKKVNDKIRVHRCTDILGLGYKAWNTTYQWKGKRELLELENRAEAEAMA